MTNCTVPYDSELFSRQKNHCLAGTDNHETQKKRIKTSCNKLDNMTFISKNKKAKIDKNMLGESSVFFAKRIPQTL